MEDPGSEGSEDEVKRQQWLGRLIKEQLPWRSAQHVTMAKFLSEYSLHDSEWVGIWFDPSGAEATALIWWDTYWAGDKIPHSSDDDVPLPVLAIKFPHIFRVVWSGIRIVTNTCISSAESQPTTEQEVNEIKALIEGARQRKDESQHNLLDADIFRTDFFACLEFDPNLVQIIHMGLVQLLCINHLGELIPLPDLA